MWILFIYEIGKKLFLFKHISAFEDLSKHFPGSKKVVELLGAAMNFSNRLLQTGLLWKFDGDATLSEVP